MSRVGIREIAERAGVSVSTVSNVLNGKKNVGDETRDLILGLCEEMNYRKAGDKIRKSKGNSNSRTILFNFSDFDRSFYLDIINGVNSYVKEHNFDLMICTSLSCEKFLRSGLTGGCIILDMSMSNDILVEMAGPDYPIITLDRNIDNPYIKNILVNNYDPMCELVQGLVDRGYRRFGFIGGPENTEDTIERYQAFMDVLGRNGIRFLPKNYHNGDYRQKSGYMATKIMILSDELPECIVCANDNMAIGCIKALREFNIRVPEDVAVTGFDNCVLAEPMGLTTVDIPNYERGYIAAQYLVESIMKGESMAPLKIGARVKWRKTVRESRPIKTGK